MRTTVTLEPDVELLLREETRKSGKSFKAVLNDSIRNSLAKPGASSILIRPLFHQPFPPTLLEANFNHLGEEWDDEDTLGELLPK